MDWWKTYDRRRMTSQKTEKNIYLQLGCRVASHKLKKISNVTLSISGKMSEEAFLEMLNEMKKKEQIRIEGEQAVKG